MPEGRKAGCILMPDVVDALGDMEWTYKKYGKDNPKAEDNVCGECKLP